MRQGREDSARLVGPWALEVEGCVLTPSLLGAAGLLRRPFVGWACVAGVGTGSSPPGEKLLPRAWVTHSHLRAASDRSRVPSTCLCSWM